MDLDHYNLLEAPPAPEPTPTDNVDDEFNDGLHKDAVNVDTEFTSYAHFNSGYPFIGVDPYVASLVEEDIKYFRPDVSCKTSSSKNPWGTCYWPGICQDDIFNGVNLTFAFGTEAEFTLPTSQLMINYTMNSQFYCALAVAEVEDMPTGVDNSERHFWFGDVFFKSFVGVFDIENQKLGMGKSVLAPSTV